MPNVVGGELEEERVQSNKLHKSPRDGDDILAAASAGVI